MRFLLLSLLVLSIPVAAQENIVAKGIPDSLMDVTHPEVKKYRSNINFPPFIGWSTNGKKMLFNGGKVIYSMNSYKSDLKEYLKCEHAFSSTLSPDHRYFLDQKDENGNEDYQLFLTDVKANARKAISTKGDKSYDPVWSPSGDRMAYKSNKVHSARVDLYLRDVDGNDEGKLVFEAFSDDGVVYDWSAEKGLLLAVKVISENDKSLYLINDQSHEIEQINANKKDIAYSAAQFIPKQQACLIVSDEFSEFLQLHRYDLTSKGFQTITADIPWDVEGVSVDAAGNQAAFSVNENGISKLYLLDLQTLQYQLVNNFPEGIIHNLKINPAGTAVACNLYGSTFRRKVFLYDLKKRTLNQVSRNGEIIIDHDFVQAESFTFPSTDPDTKERYEIPAFIYRSNKPSAPVFIDIHGGPEYQIRAFYKGFYQYLVKELGITVIVPNVRGSNGYGKSYMKMDDGLNRENAIEDIGALLDWIAQQPNLDSDRVAIFGESYGGYATLAALTKYPDRFRCGIDGVGIANWITYLKNTRDYRRDLRRVEFGDERDPAMAAFLERISPVNNIDRIKAPLLIFQGLNDPRVHYQESEQLYNRLSANNKEVWYVLAKNEGHGFHHTENYLLQRNLTISFLKKHLGVH